MNSPLGTKDRPWRARLSLMNGETTSTISAGTPVCLSVSDTSKVVLPATAGTATAQTLFAGVALSSAPPGEPVEIGASGYIATVKIATRTRAASTDSYASVASRDTGNIFTLHSPYNAFTYSAASAATLNNLCYGVLLQTIASIASAASATSDTSTLQTSTAKMWIRGLV